MNFNHQEDLSIHSRFPWRDHNWDG